ncbi:hypothetical protein [Endozoicomonas sp.]|uniref:hypothetical protein n=1 Tax=Endozoicomonas sp. TaxID=1892382 RepID=UPI00383A5784
MTAGMASNSGNLHGLHGVPVNHDNFRYYEDCGGHGIYFNKDIKEEHIQALYCVKSDPEDPHIAEAYGSKKNWEANCPRKVATVNSSSETLILRQNEQGERMGVTCYLSSSSEEKIKYTVDYPGSKKYSELFGYCGYRCGTSVALAGLARHNEDACINNPDVIAAKENKNEDIVMLRAEIELLKARLTRVKAGLEADLALKAGSKGHNDNAELQQLVLQNHELKSQIQLLVTTNNTREEQRVIADQKLQMDLNEDRAERASQSAEICGLKEDVKDLMTVQNTHRDSINKLQNGCTIAPHLRAGNNPRTPSYNGVLQWEIDGVQQKKIDAERERIVSLYSEPFYTSQCGYKMCARIYLNGDGQGKGSHVSLFFVVMKGDYDERQEWPFVRRITMELVDQQAGTQTLVDSFTPDARSRSFSKPTKNMNIASGCPQFVRQQILQDPTYVKNDKMIIKIIVDEPAYKPFTFH